MKYDYLIGLLIYKYELNNEEYKQLINYVDNSQDWNIRTSFQIICELRFGNFYGNMTCKEILKQLKDNGKIEIKERLV